MRARRFLAIIGGACALSMLPILSSAPALAAEAPATSEPSVTDVSATSATLHAVINPNEVDTKYRFEYGMDPSYGSEAPSPPAEVGAGGSPVEVSVHVTGLAPSTTYHFRVVATNAEGVVYGADATFTTQLADTVFSLPDSREYELVSPVNKHGGNIELAYFEGGMDQASESGEAMTYITNVPMAEATAYPLVTQVLSTRGSSSWGSRQIDSPHAIAGYRNLGEGVEYRAFSSDLSRAELEPVVPVGQPPLSRDAAEGFEGGYLTDVGSGLFSPLVTAAETPVGAEHLLVELVDATPDLKHLVLASEAALTPTAVQGSRFHKNLYEWAEGRLYLINVLPDGSPTTEAHLGASQTGGYEGFNVMSNDGSKVFWNAGGKTYMSEPATETTVQIGEALSRAEFQIATPDGRYALVLDTETERSEEGLYRYDTTDGSLEDVIPAGDGDASGVLGMSDNGETIYFVSYAQLASGAPEGGPELYVDKRGAAGWKIHFVASLDGDDSPDWASQPGSHVARVTASGQFAAFMSNASINGYDNRDVVSDKPDEEVYLYDAESERLICVSCNPSGARPEGEEDDILRFPMDWFKLFRGDWLAASVPPYAHLKQTAPGIRQPRYLLEDGRMFFDSRDPISPLQTGGHQNVYEYEPDGVGSCRSQSGCVYLLSSGIGASDATFLDASVSGNDVFFRSREQLVAGDVDSAWDVYDVHACTSSAPCFPTEASPPACSTADGCRAAPTPQPLLFGPPASATFDGEGDLAPGSQQRSKHKAKAMTGKLRRALRACKRRHRHARRARRRCRQRARGRYGHNARSSRRHGVARRGRTDKGRR